MKAFVNQDSPVMLFDQWVQWIFDPPVVNVVGKEYDPLDDWEANAPTVAAEYLTRLFTNSRALMEQYSDAQVGKGLSNLVSWTGWGIMRYTLDVRVPEPERLQCIRSILSLFQDCFAERCSSDVQVLPEKRAPFIRSILSLFRKPILHRESSPLNETCLMWWELIEGCCYRLPENEAILAVMRSTLSIHSETCRHSALFGLGLWQSSYPKEVKRIVNEFLAATPDLSKPLRQYAKQARAGRVP